MKIHALCIVKNEADILEESLSCALHWCDYIYVFDNGSDDGTWELVKELATQHQQIVPYKQDDVVFSSALRADIFNAFRSNADSQDWWCRLDADEFYIDDPRIFLAKIPDRFLTVYSASINYYFTDQDFILYKQDPEKFLRTPVQERLRYYMNHWGEPRFFRHSDDIVWTRSQDYGGYPPQVLFGGGPAYPVRIWLKHYQYRSPKQIEKRLLARRAAIEARNGFSHEARSDWHGAIIRLAGGHLETEEQDRRRPDIEGVRWEDRIIPAGSLNYDEFDRRYVVNENLMPEFPVRPPRSSLREAIPQPVRATFGRLRRRTRFLLEQIVNRI
jgi:glycosyltransferase involved in cell wall biosynthesis